MLVRSTFGIAALALAAAVPAQEARFAAAREPGNIVETAMAAGKFNTLLTACKAAGLVEALTGKGPFTVFAPTDDAFAKLPSAELKSLLQPENVETLRSILKYHVAAGAMPASKVVKARSIATLQGSELPVSASEDGVRIAGAMVVKTDIRCSNGIIHVVDSVMLPPATSESPNIVGVATKAGKFNKLLAAAKAAGLAEALQGEGPFTVFAPTDAAFDALGADTLSSLLKPENRAKLATIFKYHVVPARVTARDAVIAGKAVTLQGGEVEIGIDNGRLTVDGANIVATDIRAKNGIVHVIDKVITPR